MSAQKTFTVRTAAPQRAYWTLEPPVVTPQLLLHPDVNYPDANMTSYSSGPGVTQWQNVSGVPAFPLSPIGLSWSFVLSKYTIVYPGGSAGVYVGPGGTGNGDISEVVGTYTYQPLSAPGSHANTITVTDTSILAGDWADSYTGIVLPRSPVGNPSADWQNGAGKIGYGLRRNTSARTFTAAGPMLWTPSGSQGFTIWFWCKADWANLLAASQLSVSIFPHVESALAKLDVDNQTGNTKCRLFLNGVLESGVTLVDTSLAPLADGDWVFVCGAVDTVTGVLHLFDSLNGSLQEHIRAVPPNTPFNQWSAPDTVDVQIDSSTSSGHIGIVDEVGVVLDKALTLAQATALYNAGAGVTWPAVQAIIA